MDIKTFKTLSPFLHYITLEVLAKAIRQEKFLISILIGKGEVKQTLFTDDRILYIKYARKPTQKNLLELIKEFSHIASCNISA